MIANMENIVKRYGNHLAMDYVNLHIEKGEILGLLGPNGAGKTTLIHSMIGLLPIDSGEIHIFGKDLTNHQQKIKRDVGLVTQDLTIFEDLTAWDNLAFFGGIYGLKGKELKRNIEEALEIVGLTKQGKKLPSKFSGGMKRRLNIASALVHKPKFIIMDEPTVGIDPQSRNHILETIRKLNDNGTTVLYTTHYIEEAQAISSRVVILDKGHVIAEGTQQELIEKTQHEERIQVRLNAPSEKALEDIRELPGVKEVYEKNQVIQVISEVNSGNLDQILSIGTRYGGVKNINSERPTLEDVFLTLTGKQLRDGEDD